MDVVTNSRKRSVKKLISGKEKTCIAKALLNVFRRFVPKVHSKIKKPPSVALGW
jgi:hypothetical protein